MAPAPAGGPGAAPQPQNFRRDAEGTDEKIAAIMNGGEGLASPVEAVGEIARAMISAAPGHRLLIGDYGAIESRVTAWASNQQSKIDLWKQFDQTGNPNHDPYVVFGRAIGHPEISARAYGKVGDLAFGFGGGVGAWQNFAPEDDTSDEATIKRYRDTWRAQHPKTVQFWYALDRAAISAIRSPGTDHRVGRFTYRFDAPFLRVRLPSGRSISYPFAEIMPEPDRFGHPRATFLDTAGGGFGPCNFGRGAWGGIWSENIISGVARDLLAAAMLRLEAAGYPIVLHVHDEIVAELPIGFGSVDEFQRIITTLPDWADGLPVTVKVRAGARFSKPEKPAAPDHPDAVIPDDLRIPGFLLRCPAPPMAAAGDEDVDEDKPGDKAGDDHAGVVPDELAAILAAGGNDDSDASIGLHAGDPGARHGNDRAAGSTTETDQSSGAVSDDDKSGAGNGRDQGRRFDDYPHGERRTGRRLATYIYRDHLGANHTKVEKWRSPTAKRAHYPQRFWVQGRWASDKPKGWLHVPYRLSEMLAALAKDPSTDVFVPEGEKDADNIAALGLVGTTSAEGATPLRAKIGKWTPELSRWFYGVRRLFIPADNDEVGRAFAKEKARALETIVPSISIVLFPDVPEGEDVSYWLNELGHNKEELLARCEAAERWQGSGYVLVRAATDGLVVAGAHPARFTGIAHRRAGWRQKSNPLRLRQLRHHRQGLARWLQRGTGWQRHHAHSRGLLGSNDYAALDCRRRKSRSRLHPQEDSQGQ
jgi:hypothetical protein